MRSRYYIEETEVEQPINHSSISYRIDYGQETNSQVISTTSNLVWGVADGRNKKDALNIFRERISKGMLGGVGVTEGVPLKIRLDSERGEAPLLFDGYANLWQSVLKSGSETSIETPIQIMGGLDWFNDRADSVTFEYLESIGLLNSDSYIPVSYCIDKKQNALDMIVLTISIFVITDKIESEIVIISELIARLAASPDDIVAVIVQLVLHSAYTITLLIALVSLIIKLFEFLVQRVKYHYAMYVRDMFQIGLTYFGYNLKSSILQSGDFSDLIYLPEKNNININGGIRDGVEGLIKKQPKDQKGFFKGTFGEFVRQWKEFFNAKIIIDGNDFYFERDGFRLGAIGFEVPTLYDEERRFNFDDFKPSSFVEFSTDSSDRHTLKEYAGTTVHVMQLQKSVVNPKAKLGTGSVNIKFPFALAKRKTELSRTEKALRAFYAVAQFSGNLLVDSINHGIDLINRAIDLLKKVIKAFRIIGIKIQMPNWRIPRANRITITDLIDNRIGMIKMESDFVHVPKVFFLDGNGKLTKENLLTAANVFRTFHSRRLFAGENGQKPYQYVLQSATDIPFTFKDFKYFLKNNAIFTKLGEGEAISLDFNPETQTASIEYKIQVQYTNNIEVRYIEPDGY